MKRKMLLFLCTLIFVVCSAFSLMACFDDSGAESGNGGNTEQGGDTQNSDDGNSEEQDSVTVHKHSLTFVKEKSATCTKDGNTSYYVCRSCDKWFVDKDGEKEITDKSSVVILKGHKMTFVEEKEATCTKDGNSAYYTCSVCKKWFTDDVGETELTDKTSVKIPKGHKLVLVEEKAATCTTDGNIAYYICSGCERYFEDESGQKSIIYPSGVKIPKGHQYEEKVCTICGKLQPTAGLIYYINGNDGGASYVVAGIGTATDTDIVIPDEYNDKPVTAILASAFSGCSTLTSIVIPESVTSIGSSAFWNCISLTRIIIPDSVTSIDMGAFSQCSGLTNVVLGNGIKSIVSDTFKGCTNLTDISLPDSVTTIRNNVFSDCEKLHYYEYNNGLYLGNNSNPCVVLAKIKDTALNFFELNEKTKLIYNYPFSNCNDLESIMVDENNENYSSQDGILYNKEKTKFIHVPKSIVGNVSIPNGITYISSEFQGCSGLTSITIPDSVIQISQGAFTDCINLQQIENGIIYVDKWVIGCMFLEPYVTLRNDTKGIASGVFTNNNVLKSIIIPDGVTNIDAFTFGGCSNLTSITIGNGVTSIGYMAFNNCSSLTSISIPESVTKIQDAFKGCDNLIQTENGVQYVDKWIIGCDTSLLQVTLRNNSKGIAACAFANCNGLTSIMIPNSVTSICSSAFWGCSGLISITIPNSVTYISDQVFGNCSSLTSIVIPDGVTFISNGVFENCSSLTSIVIPDGVTSIGLYAFRYCSSLTNVTISDSVTSIGNIAFYGCKGLINIDFKGTKEQWEKIEKGIDIDWDTGYYTIHCTDGDVTKQ